MTDYLDAFRQDLDEPAKPEDHVSSWWNRLTWTDRSMLLGNPFKPVPIGVLIRLRQMGVELRRDANCLLDEEWLWIGRNG